jgi:pentatricopeptide repeat protein
MKYRFVFLLLLLIISLVSCNQEPEKRKIKLSNEITATRQDQKLTTTIQLEPRERRSIAVMFFQNQTGDQNLQWLQKGLTEMFIRALSQSRSLSVLSTERLHEILERIGKSDVPKSIDLDLAAIVAKEANVEAIVVGNITKNGDELKINVKLKEPNQGMVLKEESVEGPGLEKIFAMVDHLTEKIKSDLNISLEMAESSRGIAELSTNSLEAWRYYTDGVENLNKLFYKDAIAQLNKAIAIDSNFVSAYLRLMHGYGQEGMVKEAVQIYEQLQQLKDHATEQDLYNIALTDASLKGDIQTMMAAHESWLKKYPDDREANFNLATLLYRLNDHHKSIKHLEKTLQIDPNYKLAINQMGYEHAFIGNLTRAIAYFDQYQQIAPDEPNPYDSKGEIYTWYGEFKQAEKQLKAAIKVSENFYFAQFHLALVYLDQGEYKKALKTFEQYLEKVNDGNLKAMAYTYIAWTNKLLGNLDQATENFNQSMTANPFQYFPAAQLNKLYAVQNDSARARQVLLEYYDQIKHSLDNKLLRTQLVPLLFIFTMIYDIHVDETGALLNKVIAETDNPSFRLRAKFMLSQIYLKHHQFDQVTLLWQDAWSSDVVTFYKMARNIDYDGFWKWYANFNFLFYQYSKHGIRHYLQNIKSAQENDAKLFEVGFRMLLADLYFHQKDMIRGQEQLKLVGAPEEQQWLVIGSFDNKDGFHKKFPPEKKIDLAKSYQENSSIISWQHPDDGMKDGYINLAALYQKSDMAVAYGLIYVKSPDQRAVQLRLGADEAVKVWLNDQEMWRMNRIRNAVIDDDIASVTLQPGLNKILIKVINRWEDWGFYFRVTDEKGNGIPAVEFIAPDMAGPID